MPSERLQAAFDALRSRLQADLDTQLAAFRTDIDGTPEAAGSQTNDVPLDPDSAAAIGAILARLTTGLAAINAATSLSAALDALGDAASHTAGGTLFLVSRAGGNGALQSQPWRPDPDDGDARPEPAALGEVVQSLRAATDSRGRVLVPVAVGGAPVAVLVCAAGFPRPDLLTVLALHASACLSCLTALRTAQLLGTTPAAGASGEDEGARRYARLLVSEIKLYNESAVRTGRERGDLLVRLQPEIDRARRLYEERIPVSHGDRARLFQQELVHTLAAGDPTRLGAPA